MSHDGIYEREHEKLGKKQAKEDFIVGYKLVPVMRSEFSGMQVASGSSCVLLRKPLVGCGGRRDLFSKDAVDILLNDKVTQELVRIRAHELRLENLTFQR